MDCCGHGHWLSRRQWMWSTASTTLGVMLAGGVAPIGSTAAAQTAETTSGALDVLRNSISVDVHTHGGTTGITSKAPPSDDLASGKGLDFLEMKLERLEEAHQRGVRHVQLVHYTPNDIGDFQTGMVTHQGLTSFGAEVIRACHRLGFVCDVAHATAETVKQAVKVATKPLLLSHTALSGSQAMGPTPLAGRQISPDHARAVAETGGSVGIWHFFPSLDKYVDGLKEMVEVIGVDHVSIGTDQQVAPGSLQDYALWVQLVAAMLRGGFTPEDAGKIAGGNYMRIFRAAVG